MVMKTRYFIPALLTAALAVVSCDKEQGEPVISIVSGDTVKLSAVIGTPDTKIHFEGDMGDYTDTRWQEHDCIWVRSDTQPYWERGECFSTSKAKISQDGHSAEFEGRTRVDGKLCAVYPYGLVKEGSDNDKVLVDIAQSSKLVIGDCPAGSNVAAAFWADGSTSFSMKYILGAVKFSIKGNGEKVSRFMLLDAVSSNALWGTCEITPDYDAKGIASVKIVNDSPSRNRIYLDCDLTLGVSPVDFYFMVPESCLGEGFVLKAFGPDGKAIASVVSSKSNTTLAGKVIKMPATAMESVSSDGQGFEGSGIEADPFLISSSGNLCYLSKVMASDDYQKYAGKYYRQTEDIDMNSVEFAPVGSYSKPFTGNYDGNGKTISRLAVSGVSSDNPGSGVFAYAKGAFLKDLTVSGRSNTGSFPITGGIVGYAEDCTIDNCHIEGSEMESAASIFGGIVAEQSGGEIRNCSASSVVLKNSKDFTGGIVGYAHDNAVIKGCEIKNACKISSDNEVGGIVGKATGAIVESCSAKSSNINADGEDAGAIGGWVVASSTVSSCEVSECEVTSGDNCTGGLIGLLEKSTVGSCTVSQSVISGSKNLVGGIIGYMKKADESTVSECTVTGETKVSGVQNVGGIAGWLDAGSIISCNVTGKTSVKASGDGAGGLVGRAICKGGANNLISKCVVNGSVTVTGTYSVAGLVGYAYPDSEGNLYIVNSGVRDATVRATSCDTGGDPAKGDSMSAGICGWMRLSDAGSKAYIYNCYSHLNSLICDKAMVHPSIGGVVGYASLSSTGVIEIVNSVSSLVNNSIFVGGNVNAGAAKVGSIYGSLPDKASISIKNCFTIDDGVLGAGPDMSNVVFSGNQALSDSDFRSGSAIDPLNAFAKTASSPLPLLLWHMDNGYPVLQ